jgi:hypothetical protein
MTGLNLYWLAVLLLSVGCYFVLLTVMKIVRMILRERGDIEVGVEALRRVIYVLSREQTRRRLTNAFCLTVGIILGCWGTHLEMFRHIYNYRDVVVQSKYDDYRYGLQFFLAGDSNKLGESFELKLCPDTIVDWDKNSLIKSITFEDRGTCKSLSSAHTGYSFYRDSSGFPVREQHVKR